MSANNSSKAIEKAINEDSVWSNSTSNSFTESLIQDLQRTKNIYILSKSQEQKIVEILSYLQLDTNLAINKIQLIKYLESLFLKVEFNSEIFLRKFINEKEKLNLYQIIIYQYVLYTNPSNSKVEEENYRAELHSLFILLLSQNTLDRETYQYILSFLIYYINEKNIISAINKKTNNVIQDEPMICLKSEHLSRVLELLKTFYKYLQSCNEITDFFFFSGESDSSIIIQNKENPKDHNKKLLNLDEYLCIMLFIKVLPSEFIKSVYPKVIFRLLELRFNDKNKKNININIDIDNNITTSFTDKPLYQLLNNETNFILLKFNSNKKKKVINSEIYIGLNKIDLPPIQDDTDKGKGGKSKDEIKEIVLFKNFIGTCSNIIIYKEKKNEGLPKFLFSSEDNNANKVRHSSKDENNNNQNKKRKSKFFAKSLFPNGIFNEDLYSFFSKIELKDQIEPNILSKNLTINNEQKMNINDFKEFFTSNLIAIYMPTRVDIPSLCEERSLSNASQLILRDSINNLDAEFNIRSPCLNGVHNYIRVNDDFGPIGGLDNLLPILEIMTNNSELLTKENFCLFFDLISNYIFSSFYQNAIMKEDKSNFFMSLSYFLEKFPNSYFDSQLIGNFKLILTFLNAENSNNLINLNKQFANYILMNEKILFKFNEKDQKAMINTICLYAELSKNDIDIIKVIKILLYYDRKKKYKFCCKEHAEYFNDSYPIMDSELSVRIQPIEKLIENIFENKRYKILQEIKRNNINEVNKKVQYNKSSGSDSKIFEDNNFYYLLYLLTFDISPCIQKSIICLLTKMIKDRTIKKLLDKNGELFDIILFVFKTSIFDVKIHALNLLFLFEQLKNGKNLSNNQIKILIKNEILPIFLLDEINNLPSIIEETEKKDEINNNKEQMSKNFEILNKNGDKNKTDIEKEQKSEELNEKNDENININDIQEEKVNVVKINEELNYEIIENKKEELEAKINEDNNKKEENKVKYGIKTNIEKEGVKYYLFSPKDIYKKINEKYNKKKFNSLIKALYEKVINYYDDNICKEFKLNLLIEIVSNGDLLLIQSFISKIANIIKEQNSEKKDFIEKELIENKNLLHWLLETSFQFYLLNNQDKDKDSKNKSFVPGFSLNIYKINLDQSEIPYDDKEKKDICNEVFQNTQKILNYILNSKIENFDFIITWSKYYLELKKENIIYNKVKMFVNILLQEMLNGSNTKTFSEHIFLNNPKAKHTLYFINIFFEYYTFYRLEYDKEFFEEKDKIKLIKKISNDSKYILFNQREKGITIHPFDELSNMHQKIDDYYFIRVVFSIFLPIWRGDKDKNLEKENDIYSSIVGNKFSYDTELEILFYSFNDDYLKSNETCNKGIPLIKIIYHLFICFFNIGGNLKELEEYFADFRHLIVLLIKSSSLSESKDKSKNKKLNKEEQYKDVQFTIESILFNSIFYFYYRIKEFQAKIKEYKSKIKKEGQQNSEINDDSDIEIKKNLECLTQLNKIYIENLGFILKLLNKIYRGVIGEENQKRKMIKFLKSVFKGQSGIKTSGAYLFMVKLYNECQTLNLNDANNNNIRKSFFETSKLNQIDLLEKNKENNQNEKDETKFKYKTRSFRIGHKTTPDFSNYASNPNPDNEPIKDEIILNKSINLESSKKNNSNENNNNINDEQNYLDDICTIEFVGNQLNELNLDEANFKTLESHMDKFLNDININNFYKNHYEEYNKDLYPFISYMEKRKSEIEKIIPKYDNRKNILQYPINLCLVPYYYPENKYLSILLEKIETSNKNLKNEIKLNNKEDEMESYFKSNNYKNIKKKLFKFNGIWSYKEYFYDYEKYRLKYKLLNHMTNDFTKIFMTPITDIDYYLPKFSQFKTNIFRNNNESLIIHITKTADLCLDSKDKSKTLNNNNNIKSNNSTNDKDKDNKIDIKSSSFDSLDNSSISNTSEIKQDSNSNINMKQNIPLYELNQENYPFLKELELKEIEKSDNNENTHINSFDEEDYNIFIEYIKKKHFNKNDDNCLLSEACLVKLAFHIRGIIYINNKEIGFYSYQTKREGNEEDYDSDKKVCYGSVFKGQSEKYNHYYLRIPLEEIELIFKRRYYFKRNVLEIYNQEKKSYFFRIDENKYKLFLNLLNNHLKNDLEIITIDYTKYEEKIGFINKNNILYNYNNYNILFNTKKYSSIKFLYLKWVKWEISTFTLLNAMNIYSNRSYNDINQYPIFPWIITDYTSKVFPNLDNSINTTNTNNNANAQTVNTAEENTPIIRPFNTPMGMMDITPDSKERKENYQNHWQSLENDDDKDDNYDRYGSHYSTSLYLTYYLVRVFPFSYIRIELQGKKFDDPNRLFNSLSNSFECAMTQKSDLRELIPEFFCLPEMFYNINDLNLGEIVDEKTKENILVNDIKMPPWSQGDAYLFIKKHRELLESIEISEKINEWFNLIFGSKQKGKAAKNIGNLFIRQTYEDFDEVHKNSEQSEKTYQNRMVEFGVTPRQLFKNDTTKRNNVKDLKKKPILYNYQIKIGKKDVWNINEDLEIKDYDFYLEGTPYKIFCSLKKNEDVKNEKIFFLYQDKIKIFSKTNEKGFLKNIKSKDIVKNSKLNKDIKSKDIKKKEKNFKEENKDNKESKDYKDNKNNKEDIKNKGSEEIKGEKEIKESNENEESNKPNNESDNEESNSEEETEIKDEIDNSIKNKETISKYDKILISPKYRNNISETPTIIYDKGNYIALGGFWNGHILIYKLEDSGNKKDKSQKNINIISTNAKSPIIHMIIDLSETFIICGNNIGTIFVFIINKIDKKEWILHKVIENQKKISSMALSENLNIFVTCDKQGYNNLYTLPNCKLFNSYKFNENHLPSNYVTHNSSRSISNLNIYFGINTLYADHVIIFHSPLPSLIFYIKSRKSLCVYSINFHFIKEIKLGFEIVPNGIKKYTDYFSKDYLFIYNKNENTIDVYDLLESITTIARSSKINYAFVDFHFSTEMDHALIMVKMNDEKRNENTKDKNEEKNYKILVLSSQGRGDIFYFNYK